MIQDTIEHIQDDITTDTWIECLNHALATCEENAQIIKELMSNTPTHEMEDESININNLTQKITMF
jgi:hypothetical protein